MKFLPLHLEYANNRCRSDREIVKKSLWDPKLPPEYEPLPYGSHTSMTNGQVSLCAANVFASERHFFTFSIKCFGVVCNLNENKHYAHRVKRIHIECVSFPDHEIAQDFLCIRSFIFRGLMLSSKMPYKCICVHIKLNT